jgi:phospholipid transport system substrate-binding protein
MPARSLLVIPVALLLAACAGEGTLGSPRDSDAGAANQEARAATPSSPAVRVVESLQVVLMECMQRADELGFDGRYQIIAPALDQTFDMTAIARGSLAEVWNELDMSQRAQWVALTRDYTAADLADRFDRYSNQSFDIQSEEAEEAEEPGGSGSVIIRTVIAQRYKKDWRLDYRLRESQRGWRIVNVWLRGRISDVALRRAEYRAVMAKESDVMQGFEALVASLTQKIAELAQN